LPAGSVYARYYGIDYAEITEDVDFGRLCRRRAGLARKGSMFDVKGNGAVIEPAQILTTHILAIVAGSGVALPWPELARRSLGTALRLAPQTRYNRRPLRTIKNLAYAMVAPSTQAGRPAAAGVDHHEALARLLTSRVKASGMCYGPAPGRAALKGCLRRARLLRRD
jgi:hypothetical protein